MGYVSAREKAKVIRAKLKEWGFSGRDVSVRSSRGCVDISIKTDAISTEAVEKIAKPHEEISRCEYSHEILSGGNTFIFVSYDYEWLRDKAAPVKAKLEALNDGDSIEIGPCYVDKKNGYWYVGNLPDFPTVYPNAGIGYVAAAGAASFIAAYALDCGAEAASCLKPTA